MLERLGRMAARRHWLIIIAWVVIAIVIGSWAAKSGGKTNDDFSIPGTESSTALDLLSQNAPGLGNASVNVVYKATSGTVNDPPKVSAIQQSIANLEKVPGVSNVSNPFQPLPTGVSPDTKIGDVTLSRILPPSISADGTVALVSVQLNDVVTSLPADETAKLQAAGNVATSAGLEVNYSGTLVDAQVQPPPGISEYADEIGLLFAVIILLIALGSVTAMVVPIGVALFGLAISLSTLTILEASFAIGSAAPALGIMIGLGVGIDYSLFIVNRYRQNLGEGMEVETAVGRAISTSGSAVLFAAITVCLALVGLALIGIPYVRTLGVTAALFVAVTVLAALTILPALLGLIGHKIDSLRLPWHKPAEDETPEMLNKTFSARWAREIAKHPVVFTFLSIGLLLLICVPILKIELGIPDEGSNPSSLTQTQAFNQISQAFGPGRNGPLLLVADLGPEWAKANTQCTTSAPNTNQGTPAPSTTVAPTPTTAAAGGAVAPPTTAAPAPAAAVPPQVEAQRTALLQKLAPALFATPGVQSVTPVVACTGNLGVAVVIPTTGPSDPATTDLVKTLRTNVVPTALNGSAVNPSSVYIGGQTAILIDLTNLISSRMPIFVGAVLLLSFILLMMVFRSLFVAAKAVVMNLLSIGAALGFLVAVFQWGWLNTVFGIQGTLAIVAFIPVMMFAVLFGLSMDYEVFLLSRIHEEYLRSGDNRESVIAGLGATARVITAAALIMISVFVTFSFNPNVVVKMLALGMAAAVLLDASIVRMIAVPAAMELAGKWAWWIPSWLDKILPHINVDAPNEPIEPPATEPEPAPSS